MKELVVRPSGGPPNPDQWQMYRDMAGMFSKTEFVPKGLRGRPEAVLACIVAAHELGIGPMQGLRHIAIVDGKPAPSAELMVSLVRRDGHSISGSSTAQGATVTGKRHDTGDEMTVEFTSKMAERAGLLRKDNWRNYPEAMSWARAVSQLCRMLFADSIAGMGHTPDELGAETDAEGNVLVIDVTPAEIPAKEEAVQDTPGVTPPEPSRVSPTTEPGGSDTQPATDKQKQRLVILAQELGWDDDERHQRAGVQSFKDLDFERAKALTSEWTKLVNAKRRERAKGGEVKPATQPAAESEPEAEPAEEPDYLCWAIDQGKRCKNKSPHGPDDGHVFEGADVISGQENPTT